MGLLTQDPPPGTRLRSLDVFRGVTVAGMLLVNTPGSWGAIYAPLRHAPWHGWTVADLVFPFFLFVVGVTTHISMEGARGRGVSEREIVRRIARRGALIVLLGLAVSAFPYFPLERITGMRITGVLQRIGVAYAVGALISQRTSVRTQLAVLAAILVGYWGVMTAIPVPGQAPGIGNLDAPATTLAAWLDRYLLAGHLWSGSVTWDPEGVLSTVPAVGTVLLGSILAPLILPGSPRRIPLWQAGIAGAFLIDAGLLWGTVFPINKNIWTSSYVLFSGGLALLGLLACQLCVNESRAGWLSRPFEVFGKNPLVAFVGSMIMARTIYSLIRVTYDGEVIPLQSAIYRWAFLPWLEPRNASLLFAVAFVLLWYLLLLVLERRGIIIKV